MPELQPAIRLARRVVICSPNGFAPFRPGAQVICTKTDRPAWLQVGTIYEVAEPVPGFHEHPQVLEPGTNRRIDMAYGAFRVARQQPTQSSPDQRACTEAADEVRQALVAIERRHCCTARRLLRSALQTLTCDAVSTNRSPTVDPADPVQS